MLNSLSTQTSRRFSCGLLAATLLSLAVALLSGCAGTAKGRSESVYAGLDPDDVAPPTESTASALVTIRYPAMIHAEAENLYVSSFAINAIGGEVPYAVHGRRQTSRVAQSVVEKSSYYAMSVYRELKNTLPEGSVLLAPHIIDWDKDRGLYSRPILASEQVPSVLTIDFSVYSFPDVGELMNAPPVTFGDLVTPLIVIRGNRWARPALGGLMLTPILATAENMPVVAGAAAGEITFSCVFVLDLKPYLRRGDLISEATTPSWLEQLWRIHDEERD